MKLPLLSLSVVAVVGLGASLLADSVWAQDVSAPDATAVIAQPQAASAQSDSIDQQIAAWTQGGRPSGDAPGKPAAVDAGPRQIHGEAGVAFGNNGYRSGYISTDIPLGKDSDLGIAVGESQFKPRHFGTQTEKSLAISLNIGSGDLGGSVRSCASPTAPTDGRYLEPVWVSRLHGEALARDQADCAGPPVSRPAD